MTDYTAPTASTTGGAPVSKTKWIVQLVVACVCGMNIPTIVLAILGLVKADTDLPLANKLYKWGWIVFAIIWVLIIAMYAILFAIGAFSASVDTTY
ncbi:hypothetical protein GCM10009592_32020 [Brachybacterium rhamnosum]|uniref:Cardiolipin synthase N-terminal domain-containing protein n=1 Tax=Brachybacterium rhamnosum TaxID=173361 RepID=A0ABW4Q2L3_9MICO